MALAEVGRDGCRGPGRIGRIPRLHLRRADPGAVRRPGSDGLAPSASRRGAGEGHAAHAHRAGRREESTGHPERKQGRRLYGRGPDGNAAADPDRIDGPGPQRDPARPRPLRPGQGRRDRTARQARNTPTPAEPAGAARGRPRREGRPPGRVLQRRRRLAEERPLRQREPAAPRPGDPRPRPGFPGRRGGVHPERHAERGGGRQPHQPGGQHAPHLGHPREGHPEDHRRGQGEPRRATP